MGNGSGTIAQVIGLEFTHITKSQFFFSYYIVTDSVSIYIIYQ